MLAKRFQVILAFAAAAAYPSAGQAATTSSSVAIQAGYSPQSRPQSDLPDRVASALSLYQHPKDADAVAKIARRWEKDGGPRTTLDSVALSELWRRAGQILQARRVLAPYPEDDAPSLVALQRARIRFRLAGPDGQSAEHLDEAGRYFWIACETMSTQTRREMWLDLRGLSTPREQDEYAELSEDEPACGWFRRFLGERAVAMATTVELRLALHYYRLDDVRRRYYLRRTPRLTRDLTNLLGRPDSLEIDDRGLVLLRMGEPDARVGDPGVKLEYTESWAYYRHDSPKIYHFAPVSRTGYLAMGDFRMLENLAQATGITMMSDLMAAGGNLFAGLYRSRAPLDLGFEDTDFDYARTWNRIRVAGNSNNPQFMGLLFRERERTKADGTYVITQVPDVPRVSPTVRMASEILRFRRPGTDSTDVWVLASAANGDLSLGGDGDMESAPPQRGAGLASDSLSYRLEMDFGILMGDGPRLIHEEQVATTDDPLRKDDGVVVRTSLVLGPGVYPFTIAIRDARARGAIGNWARDTLTTSARPARIPEVSDIAVAPDSGGDWSRDGEAFLKVDPRHVMGRDGAVHIYFEVYGIIPERAYDVSVRVVPTTVADSLWVLPREELAFELAFPSTMPPGPNVGRATGRHYLRLELSDTAPGSYQLAVRVTDLEAGIISLPAVTEIIRLRR